jgi:large subunit ribosomal protein L32
MRHTRGHTGNRRSHHALKAENLSKCSHCGADRRPHHMCLECGYYNGRQIVDLAAKKAAREARIQAKEERIRADAGALAPTTTETKEAVKDEKK